MNQQNSPDAPEPIPVDSNQADPSSQSRPLQMRRRPKFKRLFRVNVASIAGDALLTVALADSLFFQVDPNGARWRIGLYLLFTIAPFAVVAPLLGPLMDKLTGGHRLMVFATALARAAIMVLLVLYSDTLLLFPLAFAMLVMSKTYLVAKAAITPAVVADDDDLVKANSVLAIGAAIAAAVSAVVGVALLRLGDSSWVMGLGMAVFVATAILALQISSYTATQPTELDEVIEVRSANVRIASVAMGYLRAAVGFVTMLLAFSLRGGVDPGPVGPGVELGHQVREALGGDRLVLSSGGNPPWYFGVTLAAATIGGLLGTVGAPRLSEKMSEERVLGVSLGLLGALAVIAAIIQSELVGAAVMGLAIALASQSGKQAFDALVQRDAPQANLGRLFSQYESRFQLAWVVGAMVPVVFTLGHQLGAMMIMGSSFLVLVMYWFGRLPIPSFSLSKRSLRRSAPTESTEAKHQLSEPKDSADNSKSVWPGRTLAPDDDTHDPRFPKGPPI